MRPRPNPQQRQALELAAKGRLTRGAFPVGVIASLWTHEWITWKNPADWARSTFVVTEHGLQALTPLPKAEARPLYLAPARTVAGSSLGYTTDPSRGLIDAGEVIDPTLQKRLTDEARARDEERRRKRNEQRARDRELLEAEDRLKALQQAAALRSIDVSKEAFVVKQMLAKGRKRAAVVRIERIEVHLDKAA